MDLNKTLVLHAGSGVGKSSLIQAGLIPLLEESTNKYLPVLIKLTDIKDDKNDGLLTDFVVEKIFSAAPYLRSRSLSLIPSPGTNRLWILSKALEKEGAQLVLIFDQFESLQAFNKKQRENIKKELFDLLNQKIPVDLYSIVERRLKAASEEEQIALHEEYKLLSGPSWAKVLFVVREDELGTMTLLADRFPDILKNDFTIDPLEKRDAARAIVEPAEAKGDFLSDHFSFENETILWDLIDKIADNETGLVDPIQLQIVARDLERNVVIKQKRKVINESDIPKVEDIVSKFYTDCWNTVYNKLGLNEKQFLEIKQIIVPKLIANNRRDSVMAGRIPQGKATEAMGILVSEGLIRAVPAGTDVFYQLCHDRLIAPIRKDIEEMDNREKIYEKNRRIRLYGLILLISLGILVVLSVFVVKLKKANRAYAEEKIIGAVKGIRKSNPTLAYRILRTYQSSVDHPTSENFDTYVSFFETSPYPFERMVYPYSGSIIDIQRDNDSIITVVDTYSFTDWNTNTKMIVGKRKLSQGSYVGKKRVADKDYYFVSNDDSVEVTDVNGNIQATFYAGDEKGNNIDISKDGNYIVVGKAVYNFRTKQLIDSLPSTALNSHDQMATIFLQDGRHIAAGYWSGYKFIFRINENEKKKIRISAVFNTVGGHSNYVINCLAVDSKDRFLYAGTRQNTIEVWKIDNLDSIDNICDKQKEYLNILARNMQNKAPLKSYTGHFGDINSVAMSPDDSLLLSGSDDLTAILWDATSGKMKSVLKGRASKVVGAGFLGNSSMDLYTTTDDGLVILWSRDKASKLYAASRLAKSAPFDYYTIGLARENDLFRGHIYDTAGTTDYFSNLLHYVVSMPPNNQYPEDNEYLGNLIYSLMEIDSMYGHLTGRTDFDQRISLENKRVLYDYYFRLKFRSPDLLLKTKNESEEEKFERIAEHHLLNNKTLMLDTSDIKTAISNASDYREIGVYFFDSLKDKKKGLYYHKLACELLDIFSHKFSDNQELRSEIITSYGDYAARYLYANMPDSAAVIANHLRRVKDGNGIANLRIIQVYLEKDKLDSAVKLYGQKENFIVRPDQEGSTPVSLKEWLIPRVKRLEERGLTAAAIDKFLDYLQNRPTPVHLVLER
jgi:WD40 repeat protein